MPQQLVEFVQARGRADFVEALLHFKAGKLFLRHEPLHDVGHLLDALPALADKAGLDAAQKDAVKGAKEQLFDHFGKVDEMMHGEKGAKYEDVATKIDEAVATLAGLSAPK